MEAKPINNTEGFIDQIMSAVLELRELVAQQGASQLPLFRVDWSDSAAQPAILQHDIKSTGEGDFLYFSVTKALEILINAGYFFREKCISTS